MWHIVGETAIIGGCIAVYTDVYISSTLSIIVPWIQGPIQGPLRWATAYFLCLLICIQGFHVTLQGLGSFNALVVRFPGAIAAIVMIRAV